MQLIRLLPLSTLSAVVLGIPQGALSADQQVRQPKEVQRNPWPDRVVAGVTTVLGLTAIGWYANGRFRSQAAPEQAPSGPSTSPEVASVDASRDISSSTPPESSRFRNPIDMALAGNQKRIDCIVEQCQLVVDDVLRDFFVPWHIWNPAVDVCIGDEKLHISEGQRVKLPLKKASKLEPWTEEPDERRVTNNRNDNNHGSDFLMATVRGMASNVVDRVGHYNIDPVHMRNAALGALANRPPVKFTVPKTLPLVLKA